MIVLATDGFATAETAERVGIALARTTKGKLTLVHAYEDAARADGAVSRALALAEAEGEGLARRPSDDPSSAVLGAAEDANAEPIVLGSRGLLHGEQVFGSVVRKIATNAPCDVLLTRARPSAAATTDRRTGGCSSRPTARPPPTGRPAGFALAKRLEADVALVFVGHPKTGELVLQDTVATMADEEGVTVRTSIRGASRRREIIAEATADRSDLVVVGNRGLAGAKAMPIGSVPLTVAEECGTDVLIARTIAQSLGEIGLGEGGIVTSADHKVAVYRDPAGLVHTLSASCTHMGCTVKWNPSEKTWDCPCHGSRFGPTGR